MVITRNLCSRSVAWDRTNTLEEQTGGCCAIAIEISAHERRVTHEVLRDDRSSGLILGVRYFYVGASVRLCVCASVRLCVCTSVRLCTALTTIWAECWAKETAVIRYFPSNLLLEQWSCREEQLNRNNMAPSTEPHAKPATPGELLRSWQRGACDWLQVLSRTAQQLHSAGISESVKALEHLQRQQTCRHARTSRHAPFASLSASLPAAQRPQQDRNRLRFAGKGMNCIVSDVADAAVPSLPQKGHAATASRQPNSEELQERILVSEVNLECTACYTCVFQNKNLAPCRVFTPEFRYICYRSK